MQHLKLVTLLSVLAGLASAAPLNKRDLVVVTDWDIVTITDFVVETVWTTPGALETTTLAIAAPTPASSSVLATSEATNVLPVPVSSTMPPATSALPITSTIPVPASTSITSISIPPPSAPTSTTPAVVPSSSAPVATPSSTLATSIASAPTSAPIQGLATSGTSYTGDLTYYATGLGSCGWTSGYNDAIVAVSHNIMDVYNPGNPNNNPLCGRKVNISYGGQTFQAEVVDTCEGCATGDLDLSEGFFSTVTGGDTAAGRIHGVSWSWA